MAKFVSDIFLHSQHICHGDWRGGGTFDLRRDAIITEFMIVRDEKVFIAIKSALSTQFCLHTDLTHFEDVTDVDD